jgi:hypothetical protein
VKKGGPTFWSTFLTFFGVRASHLDFSKTADIVSKLKGPLCGIQKRNNLESQMLEKQKEARDCLLRQLKYSDDSVEFRIIDNMRRNKLRELEKLQLEYNKSVNAFRNEYREWEEKQEPKKQQFQRRTLRRP